MKKYLLPVLCSTLLAAPLSLFASTMTPMQTTAHQLQSDLNQALDESSFNATQRYHLSQDAVALVQAANQRAAGHRMDRHDVRKSAKALLQAFDSGEFQIGDVSMLNSDFNAFKQSIR